MKFAYSREGLSSREMWVQRFFEILPGATSWFLIIGLLVLSFCDPRIASVLVIVFLLAWIFRLFYLTILLMVSYFRLSLEKNTNWMNRVRGLDQSETYLQELNGRKPEKDWRVRISSWAHRRDVLRLTQTQELPPRSTDIYHLVVIPVISEEPEVLRANLKGISESQAITKQMLIVVALESRAKLPLKTAVQQLGEDYRDCFFDLLVVEHPSDLPGEAHVKGANISYAAKKAAEFFKNRRIPTKNVIVSCFDADTVVSPQYFSCLTYSFMVCPDRYRASFQPIPVFYNNIWEVPGFARVVETGSSLFQLVEKTDPEKLVTFSSHSMSFQALVEVGYWPVDMISDDSGIYWKAYLHYDGQYCVVPLLTTLSMDVLDAGAWWKTVVSLYKQKRRWAWGVENFPLVMRGFLQNPKISFYNKLRHGFKLFEGHITWATLPLLLTFVGWLPALFSKYEFSHTVLYYSASRITQTIFSLSSLALFSTVLLSLWLLPKKKKRFSLFWTLIHGLEWLLVPIILIFLSAMPALDAQTRLMLNKRMEFRVSEKRRLS